MFEVAKRVEERGTFKVHRFKSKGDLKKMANQIGSAYNNTFVNNWEYYPLTEGEVKLLLNNLLTVAIPDLIKIITHNDEIVGFLLAFPDVSAVMQKYNGNISLRTPFALLDVMNELKRTNWVSLNGAGVLPRIPRTGRECFALRGDGKDDQELCLRACRADTSGGDHSADARPPVPSGNKHPLHHHASPASWASDRMQRCDSAPIGE